MKKIVLTLMFGSLVFSASAIKYGTIRKVTVPASEYASHISGLSQMVPAADTTGQIAVEVIAYRTLDPRGIPVMASGIVTYPADKPLKGVVMGQHGTIMADRQAPSNYYYATEASQLATYGYMVITPDYIGYGTTVTMPHPYLDVDNTGRVSVDMLFAVRDMMAQRGVELGDSVTVVGYSQGAAAALSFQKMAEEQYGDRIKVKHTYIGGGPYDPMLTFQILDKLGVAYHPCLVPLSVIGFDYGSDLGLDLASVFEGGLKEHYGEWVLNKRFDTSQVDSLIGTTRLDAIVSPALFSGDAASERFADALVDNRLTGWKPQAPLFIFHAKDDTYVPVQNAYALVKSLEEQGFTDYVFKEVPGDHITPLFMIDVLNMLGR